MGGTISVAVNAGSIFCRTLRITIVQLVNLSRTESVDGIGIATFILTLHRQCDTAGAACVALYLVGAGNSTCTHQLVAGTELTFKLHGADVTRLLRSINIHKGFLHARVSIDIIAVIGIVGRISLLTVTPLCFLLCHKGVCTPVTAIAVE